MGPGPHASVLLQMVEQNDQKHEQGHGRLRLDMRDVQVRLASLERTNMEYKLRFATMDARKERRHDLSNYKAIILAAAIGGGVQVLVALAKVATAYMRGTL